MLIGRQSAREGMRLFYASINKRLTKLLREEHAAAIRFEPTLPENGGYC
jgi:hypothetical protein